MEAPLLNEKSVKPSSKLRYSLALGSACALLGGGAVAVYKRILQLDSLANIPVAGCPFVLNEENVLLHGDSGKASYPLHMCYAKKSDMCGYEAFSQPSLQCPAVAENLTVNNYPDIPRRSFGVEFELVAREWGNCGPETMQNGKDGYWSCLAEMQQRCLPSFFGNWNWEFDLSIKTVEEDLAADLVGAGARAEDETRGFPFEADSPLPPYTPAGKEGLDSVALALDTFKAMGVQSNPSSGFHVHVNVGHPTGFMTPGTEGSKLSARQVANLWTAYARFQLVIDSHFLQSARVGNRFCRPLVLGRQCVGKWGTPDYTCLEAEDFDTGCVTASSSTGATPAAVAFRNMHAYFRDPTADNASFVDRVYGTERTANCLYNGYRYTQLNLEALNKYGTLEFRGFPATYDAGRYLAWINFLMHFVERYKDCPSDAAGHTCDFFSHADAQTDLELLTRAQATATLDDLASELGEPVVSYFRRKPWLRSAACKA